MRATWILSATLVSLCACGGSSSGGGDDGGGGGATVVFHDGFDSGASLADWIGNPGGAATLDGAHGDPTPPCLNLSGGTADLQRTFEVGGGLEMFVRVRLPPGTVCAPPGSPGGAICCPTILEVRTTLGNAVAGVETYRGLCSGPALLRTWIKNAAQNVVEETLPLTFFTGQFVDLGFYVGPDGSASWSRDGVIRQTLPAGGPWGTLRTDVRYTLRLSSMWGDHGLGALDVAFDDVQVQRP